MHLTRTRLMIVNQRLRIAIHSGVGMPLVDGIAKPEPAYV
jgi:hypothetical protein